MTLNSPYVLVNNLPANQTGPPVITYANAIGNYAVTNLYMAMETISFGDESYRRMLDSRLSTGDPIIVPFTNWASFETSAPPGSTNSVTQVIYFLWLYYRPIMKLIDIDFGDVFAKVYSNSTNGYKYVTDIRDKNGQPSLLHRLVKGCQPGDGLLVDHLNGNKHDNRRSNLRIIHRAANNQRGKLSVGKHGYRGVRKTKFAFVAVYGKGATRKHIGSFRTAASAAAAYDNYVRILHGPHAWTNF